MIIQIKVNAVIDVLDDYSFGLNVFHVAKYALHVPNGMIFVLYIYILCIACKCKGVAIGNHRERRNQIHF